MPSDTSYQLDSSLARCAWVDGSEIYTRYHDEEWGRPCYDDQQLFEMLVLESFQAGLAWITILRKRENFRAAFDGFDPHLVAQYGEDKVQELLANEGIIRHRGKIAAAIHNARLYLEIQREYGSFSQMIWGYVDHQPIMNDYRSHRDVPATTALSDQISKDLKKRGFKFMGSTIVYAYMQAIGMVNDHTTDCYLCVEQKTS